MTAAMLAECNTYVTMSEQSQGMASCQSGFDSSSRHGPRTSYLFLGMKYAYYFVFYFRFLHIASLLVHESRGWERTPNYGRSGR